MSHHTLTLDILEQLYARLAERASLSQRSVADEALAAMALTIPTEGDLAPALARALHEIWNRSAIRNSVVRQRGR